MTIIWHWPQITWGVLMALSLLISAHENGKPRGPHNFSIAICALALNVFILYNGGFWAGATP